MSEKVDRKDIQGLLASGYDHLNYTKYLFLRVKDALKARAWLAKVVDKVTTAEYPGKHKPANCLNIALTFKGIQEMGIADDLICGFSHEFEGGMIRPEAAQILGDNGPSDQGKWEFGSIATERERPLHLLVLLYADSANSMKNFARACDLDPIAATAANIGLELVKEQDASHDRDDLTEPFGFRDGISQPAVEGLTGKSSKHRDLIKTGEFVLGYKDGKGLKSTIPSIDNWYDPEGYLADHPDYPNDRRAFGLNGTYLVFRKLSQNVSGFWNYIDLQTGADPQRRELLAARFIGRWRSGSPLVLAPDKPGAEPVNDFLYTPTDPDGLACPVGAHIRRANPRDSLPNWPSVSLATSNRHRIIRRGRKYRTPIDGVGEGGKPGNQDQGLCFIALNADLLRQFEFIQYTWLNNPQFNGLDKDKDPVVGDNNGSYQFTVQGMPLNCHVKGLPRFVTMKGGGYFFLPGLRALRFLANYDPIVTAHAAPGMTVTSARSQG